MIKLEAKAGMDFFAAIGSSASAPPGVFTPVLAKHTKRLSLVDMLSAGVDRMQRNFEPIRKQVDLRL